ncbi:MAG: hypothetical protein AABX29_04725 [Nanoarchaeota archaeon]
MTIKYELTKLYLKKQEVTITADSYFEFKAGLRQDLEHLIVYHHQTQKVVCRPRIKGYRYYKLDYGSTDYSQRVHGTYRF